MSGCRPASGGGSVAVAVAAEADAEGGAATLCGPRAPQPGSLLTWGPLASLRRAAEEPGRPP